MKLTSVSASAESRTYNSPLRERQSELTRESILEALTAELAEGGLHELNIPSIARRAGVSIRTVYRYFPTRESLLDAAERWMDTRIGVPQPPRTADDLPTLVEKTFADFDANETAILAQWATALGRDMRARGRRRRVEAYREALANVTLHLSARDARAAHAVISYLISSGTWKTLREEHGMSGAESGKAVAWALRVLIDDVRTRNQKASRHGQ
jgi:AcrR family transcriptional regulator